MALQAIGDCIYPPIFERPGAAAFQAHLLDASGEYFAMVFRAPKTGNLRKFAARLGTIGNTPDNGLRYSFQTVDVTTGLPDGSVDQFATIASGSLSANAWNDPGNFDAARAVVKGEIVAAVIDFPSFVAGDSLNVMAYVSLSAILGYPYCIHNGTESASTGSTFAVMYDDDTWGYLNNALTLPASAVTTATFQVGTGTADEYGMSFTLPGPATCKGMVTIVNMVAAGTTECLLYQGTTVKRTATVDHDILASNSLTPLFYIEWDDGDFDLDPNTVYTIAVRPTAAVNIAISYYTWPSLAIVQGALVGGNNIYLSRRLDQGAWQHFNNETDGYARPQGFGVILSSISDGLGGGTVVFGG